MYVVLFLLLFSFSKCFVVVESVVCAYGCDLNVNGDNQICSKQPKGPPNGPHSYIIGNGVDEKLGSLIQVQFQVNDPYNRAVNVDKDKLNLYLKRDQLILLTTISIFSMGPIGQYVASFVLPYPGTFALYCNTTQDVPERRKGFANSPIPITIFSQDSSNLLGLWITIGFVAALGIVIGGIVIYRKYWKRLDYQPLAGDHNSKSSQYGGVGFASTDAEEI